MLVREFFAIIPGNMLTYQLLSNDSLVINIAENFTFSMEKSIDNFVFSMLDENPYIKISVQIDSQFKEEVRQDIYNFMKRSVYHYNVVSLNLEKN